MLPEDQIEEQKNGGTLDGEIEDAYGEIANILSGSLTQTFLDRYPQQIRFIKTESETVVPTKVDVASDQPFPDGKYYLASFAIHLEGHDLHRILLIFPAEVFDLDNAPADTTAQAASNSSTATTGAETTASGDTNEPAPGEWGGPPVTAKDEPSTEKTPTATKNGENAGATAPAATEVNSPTPQEPTGAPIVLVISDQPAEAEPFVEILSSENYESRVLTFQDEIRGLFQQHKILGILLVMAQVGEKGFASAIKLQSAGRPLPPIIFAGPEWTRSAVLRAVKYGAKDILVTPASNDEIQDKVSRHFQKAS
jgi:CheY-like chemotaxis protein